MTGQILTLKCKKVREILINNSNYQILIDIPYQRNGFAAFIKIK